VKCRCMFPATLSRIAPDSCIHSQRIDDQGIEDFQGELQDTNKQTASRVPLFSFSRVMFMRSTLCQINASSTAILVHESKPSIFQK
jgi:hypothetical protein